MIAQIETKEVVANAEEIVAVDSGDVPVLRGAAAVKLAELRSALEQRV